MGEDAKYTEEQVQKMIDEKVAKVKEGMYSQEDFDKKLTAEVDRRVESGIQKGLETYKSKWQEEYEQKAKLTAEELAQKELEEKMKEISTKETEIQKRANLLDAKDKLSQAGVPKNAYEKMLGTMVTPDKDMTNTNIENFIEVFKSTKEDIEKEIKKQYSNVEAPSGGEGSDKLTKDSFKKMGYAEKLKLKQENPEKYKEFIKD